MFYMIVFLYLYTNSLRSLRTFRMHFSVPRRHLIHCRLKSARQASQTEIFSWKRAILDQNPMHRCRKHRFWTKIRFTGVANSDFSMCFCYLIWDQTPIHRCRKRWFWIKIRCTGVANSDFCIFFNQNTADSNSLDRRRKRWLLHKNVLFGTKIRCTGVANADFRPKSDAQVAQTVNLAYF